MRVIIPNVADVVGQQINVEAVVILRIDHGRGLLPLVGGLQSEAAQGVKRDTRPARAARSVPHREAIARVLLHRNVCLGVARARAFTAAPHRLSAGDAHASLPGAPRLIVDAAGEDALAKVVRDSFRGAAPDGPVPGKRGVRQQLPEEFVAPGDEAGQAGARLHLLQDLIARLDREEIPLEVGHDDHVVLLLQLLQKVGPQLLRGVALDEPPGSIDTESRLPELRRRLSREDGVLHLKTLGNLDDLAHGVAMGDEEDAHRPRCVWLRPGDVRSDHLLRRLEESAVVDGPAVESTEHRRRQAEENR